MIKINLLPQLRAKKAKKHVEIQYQLWLFGGFLAILVVIMVLFGFYLSGRVEDLRGQKIAMEQKLTVLKAKVKEVENFENDKKIFQEKIKVIQQLKLNQGGPVHLLDQVSRNLPSRVWLVGLSQQGKSINIDGKAMTNSELVDFIDNLKRSKFFSDIQLLESRQATEGNVPIYNFKLSCVLVI